MAKVEKIGVKEANRALRALPEYVRVDVQQVIDVSAFHVWQAMRGRARRLTGRLIDAIKWASRPRSLSAVVGVEAVAFYWKYLEYGTVKMAAKPFARPAAESQKPDHERRLVAGLSRALGRLGRGY